MIAYRKYVQEKTNEGTMLEITKTTLDAKLRFKKETAPVYRKDVKERMNIKNSLLLNYLIEVEGIFYNKDFGTYKDLNPDKKRTITIKKRPYKLGIDVHIASFMNIKLEDMLNLEGLNELIQENSLK